MRRDEEQPRIEDLNEVFRRAIVPLLNQIRAQEPEIRRQLQRPADVAQYFQENQDADNRQQNNLPDVRRNQI